MLDLQKTQLQATGETNVDGLTLAQIIEIVTDIGLRPDEVDVFYGPGGGTVIVSVNIENQEFPLMRRRARWEDV